MVFCGFMGKKGENVLSVLAKRIFERKQQHTEIELHTGDSFDVKKEEPYDEDCIKCESPSPEIIVISSDDEEQVTSTARPLNVLFTRCSPPTENIVTIQCTHTKDYNQWNDCSVVVVSDEDNRTGKVLYALAAQIPIVHKSFFENILREKAPREAVRMICSSTLSEQNSRWVTKDRSEIFEGLRVGLVLWTQRRSSNAKYVVWPPVLLLILTSMGAKVTIFQSMRSRERQQRITDMDIVVVPNMLKSAPNYIKYCLHEPGSKLPLVLTESALADVIELGTKDSIQEKNLLCDEFAQRSARDGMSAQDERGDKGNVISDTVERSTWDDRANRSEIPPLRTHCDSPLLDEDSLSHLTEELIDAMDDDSEGENNHVALPSTPVSMQKRELWRKKLSETMGIWSLHSQEHAVRSTRNLFALEDEIIKLCSREENYEYHMRELEMGLLTSAEKRQRVREMDWSTELREDFLPSPSANKDLQAPELVSKKRWILPSVDETTAQNAPARKKRKLYYSDEDEQSD